MKTTLHLNLRAFYVVIEDTRRPGEVEDDIIVLDKSQLQAAQVVGQSSKELIYRIYNRKGYVVKEIAPAIKVPVELDLAGLYELNNPEQEGGF